MVSDGGEFGVGTDDISGSAVKESSLSFYRYIIHLRFRNQLRTRSSGKN
jgi:hypothetical protein